LAAPGHAAGKRASEPTNVRRYEYRRSRDAARFNTDVIRRRANRGSRREDSARRHVAPPTVGPSGCGDRAAAPARAASSDLFPSLSTPAGNISLDESHFRSRGLRSRAAERAGRHTPGSVRGLGRPPGPGRDRRMSDSTLPNRPCAERYAVAAGAKDAPRRAAGT